ncbi:hypothetical protein [Thalassotalea sp. PLHSN55]|uniref:hypothetical protein n=1 Tax=Thalassotalea sp. PLHSN55 TaxID=3435888 RepID=UPI003F82AC85
MTINEQEIRTGKRHFTETNGFISPEIMRIGKLRPKTKAILNSIKENSAANAGNETHNILEKTQVIGVNNLRIRKLFIS